jgi:hypothetical protein
MLEKFCCSIKITAGLLDANAINRGSSHTAIVEENDFDNEHGFALSMSLQTELIWSSHRVDSKENFVLTSTKSNKKGAGMGKSTLTNIGQIMK